MGAVAGVRLLVRSASSTLSHGGGCLAGSATPSSSSSSSSPSSSSASAFVGMRMHATGVNQPLPTSNFPNRRKDQAVRSPAVLPHHPHSPSKCGGGEKRSSTTASALPFTTEVAAMAVAAAAVVPVCWVYFNRTKKAENETTAAAMLGVGEAMAEARMNGIEATELNGRATVGEEMMMFSSTINGLTQQNHMSIASTTAEATAHVDATYVAVAELQNCPKSATWLTLGQSQQDLSLVNQLDSSEIRTHAVSTEAVADLHIAVRGPLGAFVADGPVVLEAWINDFNGKEDAAAVREPNSEDGTAEQGRDTDKHNNMHKGNDNDDDEEQELSGSSSLLIVSHLPPTGSRSTPSSSSSPASSSSPPPPPTYSTRTGDGKSMARALYNEDDVSERTVSKDWTFNNQVVNGKKKSIKKTQVINGYGADTEDEVGTSRLKDDRGSATEIASASGRSRNGHIETVTGDGGASRLGEGAGGDSEQLLRLVNGFSDVSTSKTEATDASRNYGAEMERQGERQRSGYGAIAAPTSSSCSGELSGRVKEGQDIEAKLGEYRRLTTRGNVLEALMVLEEISREGGARAFHDRCSGRISHKAFLRECKKKNAVAEAFRFVALFQKPPLSVYSLVLSVCASAGDVDGALKVFAATERSGYQPDCILYTALISTCAKAGKLELAFKIYHEMDGANVAPNAKTYGALIDGCARAGQVAKAFGVFGIVLSKGIEPDRVIFNSLIHACSRAGALERAFDVYKDMQEAGFEANSITFGSLMDACARAGDLPRALEVYKLMMEDVRRVRATSCKVFTTAVHACSESGDLDQAMAIYGDMREARVKPDQVFFSSLIDVAGHAGQVDAAFGFLDEMRQVGLRPNAIVYSALMGVCSLAGPSERERGMALYARLKTEGARCSASTYNALIKLHGAVGDLDAAEAMVAEMRAAGVPPNQITYDLLLSACARVQDADRAYDLYGRARSEGVRPFLSACVDLASLSLAQIKNNAPAPKNNGRSSFYSLGQSAWDVAEKPARQQWAALALAVYRETLAAGVVPTKSLLSLLMGCGKIPDSPYDPGWGLSGGVLGEDGMRETHYALNGFDKTTTGRGRSRKGGKRSSFSSTGEGVYDPRTVAMYEEAAAMGVVPQFSCMGAAAEVNMEDMPVHLAQVCILALLKACKRRRASALEPSIKSVTLKLSVESRTVAGRTRSIPLASRSAQAVAALLRKIELPFRGTPSSGGIQLNGDVIMKWLDPNKDQLSTTGGPRGASFRLQDPGNPYKRLAKSIADQQRAIRLGDVAPYSRELDFLGRDGGNGQSGRARRGWLMKNRTFGSGDDEGSL